MKTFEWASLFAIEEPVERHVETHPPAQVVKDEEEYLLPILGRPRQINLFLGFRVVGSYTKGPETSWGVADLADIDPETKDYRHLP